jgi:hypothetical protein
MVAAVCVNPHGRAHGGVPWGWSGGHRPKSAIKLVVATELASGWGVSRSASFDVKHCASLDLFHAVDKFCKHGERQVSVIPSVVAALRSSQML